jgi:hypothetical protein
MVTPPMSLKKIVLGRSSEEIAFLKQNLANFKCSRDLDVEKFLSQTAFEYDKCNKTRTYVCRDETGAVNAYFSLSTQALELNDNIPKSFRKRLTFGRTNLKWISVYLIAQIGKDDSCLINKIGVELLEEAHRLISEASDIVGGRVVYLECKKENKLRQLYEKEGFRYLQDNEDLIQMVKII